MSVEDKVSEEKVEVEQEKGATNEESKMEIEPQPAQEAQEEPEVVQ